MGRVYKTTIDGKPLGTHKRRADAQAQHNLASILSDAVRGSRDEADAHRRIDTAFRGGK
jgi:hypothetical protein